MTDEIICGPDHLGNCPRCGYAIVEISREPVARSGGLITHPTGICKARCVTGHTLANPRIVARIDAPSPVYPPDADLR